MQLLKLECYKPLNIYDTLFLTMAGSTLVLLTIPFVSVVCVSVQSLMWALGLRERSPSALRVRTVFVNRMWNLFLFLCFFLFPPVSTTLWKTLRCTELSPGNYALWADLSIPCHDAKWNYWVIFALVGIGMYTVGIPLFFLLILWRNNRKLVLQTPHCQARYGFLYQKYADSAWYWELVEMMRKLIFTSIIMFLATGTSGQVVIAMAISFTCLMLHLRVQAYKEPSDLSLQTLSQTCIFITLWLGLLIRTGVINELLAMENPVVTAAYNTFTVAVSILPGVGGLLGMIQKTCSVLGKSQVLGTFGGEYGGTACCQLAAGEGSLQQVQANVLNLAMAGSTDTLGEMASEKKAELAQKKVAKRSKRNATREHTAEERTSTHTRSSHSGHESDETEEAEALATILERNMRMARLGTPCVKKDPSRHKYLVQLRISVEAVVVRHYPYGKGFLVRLNEEQQTTGFSRNSAVSIDGRPPQLFVKIWSEHFDGHTGFAQVKYDLRDTGFKVDPEVVIYHPVEYNRQLIMWEAKQEAKRSAAEAPVRMSTAAASFASKMNRKSKSGGGFEAVRASSAELGDGSTRGLGGTQKAAAAARRCSGEVLV